MVDNDMSLIEGATIGVSPRASQDTEISNFGPVRVDAIQQIAIEQLETHYNNPRLILREDVIEIIRAEIAEHGFRNEHALLVRPVEDKFQIISGHQRTEAARRANLKTVPCWVREMSDEEELMQLVLSNAQGELSGLECGIHALTAVGKAEPGRGKKGGYSEYSRASASRTHLWKWRRSMR